MLIPEVRRTISLSHDHEAQNRGMSNPKVSISAFPMD